MLQRLAKTNAIKTTWPKSQDRLLGRAEKYGYANGQRLWCDVLVQAGAGRRDGPIPIPTSGPLHEVHPDRANVAFLFGAEQAEKLRACGDLKRNWANIECAVWTPIALPARGHIAQSELDLRKRRLDW